MKKHIAIMLGAVGCVLAVGTVFAAQTPSFGSRLDACVNAAASSTSSTNDMFQGLSRLRLYRRCFQYVFQQEQQAWRSSIFPPMSSSVSSSSSSVSSTSSSGSSVSSESSVSSGSGVTVNTVSLMNNFYSPRMLTVKKGTTVTWKNFETSRIPHTVTRNDAFRPGPLSNVLMPGDTYTYTFTATGSYAYHCAFHPTMTGAVLVTQ